MAKVLKTIKLTEEEKEILTKAKEIFEAISEELGCDAIEWYENSNYITDILNILEY